MNIINNKIPEENNEIIKLVKDTTWLVYEPIKRKITEAGGVGAYDDDDINTGKESIQEEKPVKNCVNLNSLPWKNTLDKSSGQ